MSSELVERLEILRRIGERGLRKAQRHAVPAPGHRPTGDESIHAEYLDLWQHLLDELKRVPTGNSDANT